jgi:hypothetical protein
MNETPALRNFLVHHPGAKQIKSGADLAIASIPIPHKAVVATGHRGDFLLIHRHFPLPGLYDPFRKLPSTDLRHAVNAFIIGNIYDRVERVSVPLHRGSD